uniref:E3 SUMO-protein ligase RanBP2-like n=1 Tax=Gouania willdenowi TaxID=441366 RepID=A0A8C5DVA4_GOUWI
MKSSSSQQPSAGFTIPFGDGSPFQFGQNKVESSPASFKFEAPQSAVSSSTSSGFSFSFPNTSSGFKFGIQEPAKESKPTENLMTSGSFEPIIQMPEKVDLVTEEDEEILFKERTKLFRWDRDLGQWKERGIGDIKILFHPAKHFYRILMRRDQVFRVCANHTISPGIELKSWNYSCHRLFSGHYCFYPLAKQKVSLASLTFLGFFIATKSSTSYHFY